MKTSQLLPGLVTFSICSAASADELGAHLAGGRVPATALYLESHVGARHDEAPSPAPSLIGPGVIVGIVIGALLAVSALDDGSDGDGGY